MTMPSRPQHGGSPAAQPKPRVNATAIQAVIVVGGSLPVTTSMIALMVLATQSERRYIDRRRAEWIVGGRIPGEQPNIYLGSGGEANMGGR